MFPCAIKQQKHVNKNYKRTTQIHVQITFFFSNECLINLRQRSASQWPVCRIRSAFQQLHSRCSSNICDDASISIKKPPNVTLSSDGHWPPLSKGSVSLSVICQ